jgi:biopolymer transport protein TolQ
MNATQDLSFITLIANASLLVQLVMLLLLGVSLTSWSYIFSKMFTIKKARQQTESFERSFWSGGNLVELYQDISAARRE